MIGEENNDLSNDESNTEELTNISKEKQFEVLFSSLRDGRHKILALEESSRRKQANINELKCKGAKLEGELKRLEGNNKRLKRQLNEERSHYSLEKQKFCEEMLSTRRFIVRLQNSKDLRASEDAGFQLSPTSNLTSTTNLHTSLFTDIAALKAENEKLRRIVERSDEKNHSIRVSLRRLCGFQMRTLQCFNKLEKDFIQVLRTFMDRFNDVREEFNFVHAETFKNVPLSPVNAKYLEMTKANTSMAYENACLRLELQCLQKDINKRLFGPGRILKRNKSKARKNDKKLKEAQRKYSEEVGEYSDVGALKISLSGLEGDNSEMSQCSYRGKQLATPLKRSLSSPSL